MTVIDLRHPFTEQVIGYFTGSYRSGQTPNPCILCNATIKFGLFAQAMLQRQQANAVIAARQRIVAQLAENAAAFFNGEPMRVVS